MAASVLYPQLSPVLKPFVCRSSAIGSMLMLWLAKTPPVALSGPVNRMEGGTHILLMLWCLVYKLLLSAASTMLDCDLERWLSG